MKLNQLKYFLPAAIIFSAVFSFLLSHEFLLNFSNDDSFFYIKTANNFANGKGSTFDNINLTNGYHPLWFLILSLYYFLLNFISDYSPEVIFRFTVFLVLLICIATLFILYFVFKLNYKDNSAKNFYLFIPLYLTFICIRDYGMETHILCLLVSAYIYFKSVELNSERNETLNKSILLTMIFLCRVDYLFLVIPVIFIADILTMDKTKRRKFILTSLSILLLVSALYFTVNYNVFGSALPVTAKVKNTFPEILFSHNIGKLLEPGAFTNQFAKTVFTFSAILIFLFLTLLSSFRKKLIGVDYFLFGICCAAAFYLIINIIFNKHALKEWYVAFPAFVSSLMIVRIVILIPRIYYFSFIVFTAMFIFMFYFTRIRNPKWISAYNYSQEIKRNTSTDDRIFMIDLSGITGFYSERNIVNGDGLINSIEYLEYLQKGKLNEYFKVNRINYYSTYSQDYAPMPISENNGLYTDNKYSYTFGNYPFIFQEKDLKLKFPYYYSYIGGDGTGYWYLFKLNEN